MSFSFSNPFWYYDIYDIKNINKSKAIKRVSFKKIEYVEKNVTLHHTYKGPDQNTYIFWGKNALKPNDKLRGSEYRLTDQSDNIIDVFGGIPYKPQGNKFTKLTDEKLWFKNTTENWKIRLRIEQTGYARGYLYFLDPLVLMEDAIAKGKIYMFPDNTFRANEHTVYEWTTYIIFANMNDEDNLKHYGFFDENKIYFPKLQNGNVIKGDVYTPESYEDVVEKYLTGELYTNYTQRMMKDKQKFIPLSLLLHSILFYNETYYDETNGKDLKIVKGKFVHSERNTYKYYPIYTKKNYTAKNKKNKTIYQQTKNGYITFTKGNITYTFNNDNNIIIKEEDTEIYERNQRQRGEEQTMDA